MTGIGFKGEERLMIRGLFLDESESGSFHVDGTLKWQLWPQSSLSRGFHPCWLSRWKTHNKVSSHKP
jgi:hypothetical protein